MDKRPQMPSMSTCVSVNEWQKLRDRYLNELNEYTIILEQREREARNARAAAEYDRDKLKYQIRELKKLGDLLYRTAEKIPSFSNPTILMKWKRMTEGL